MSFSLVGVSGEGTTLIVNSEDLPQPPPAPNFPTQSDANSTITPFSNYLNVSSFANNFSTISTINSVLPGFSTFSNPSWNPYAPAPEQPLEDLNGIYNNSLSNPNSNMKKRPWESPPPLSAAAAALRKKRMKNIYEEEEATCAKCHYRRKCMKCTNCFARFCEQRCLPRYLEDPTAQEEVKISNTWLCPCCKGIEPPGKYKGSDIMRKDVEDSKDKDDEDDDNKSNSNSNSSQIVPQQSPIQTQQSNYYQDQHTQPFNNYMQQSNNFQLQHLQLQQQQQQQQQLKLQQMQQMQQMQQQQQMQILQQQHQMQQMHMQQQFPQHPHLQQPQPATMHHPLASPQLRQHPQLSQTLPPSTLLSPSGKPDGAPHGKKGRANGEENGGGGMVPGNGGAVVGVGREEEPGEYPKEEEDFCSVCGDIYSYDDNNEIIYCDGCNVAVHQACYGVNKVPAGEWRCDRCKAGVLPTCHLCSQKGGAMKELVDLPGHWVHVTCVAALYELRPLDFSKKLGPPGLLDKIDKRRYKLKCENCRETNRKDVTGPLIQCKRKRCVKAFHPICCKRKLSYCKELGIFATYCKQHSSEEVPQ